MIEFLWVHSEEAAKSAPNSSNPAVGAFPLQTYWYASFSEHGARGTAHRLSPKYAAGYRMVDAGELNGSRTMLLQRSAKSRAR
jgi:hypothetical protein